MNDLIEQVLSYLSRIWRFHRVAVAVAVVLTLVGWLVVLAWPDSYQAQARVYVDSSTALKPLLQGMTVDPDVDSRLSLVKATLLGTRSLERVARAADLDLKVKSPEDRELLVLELRSKITIEAASPNRNVEDRRLKDSIYTIKYQNRQRDKALIVVRTLLNSLMEDTLGGERSGADAAQKFLREQIADYAKRLAASEADIAAFKQRNVGSVPGAQGDYFSRLQNEVAEGKKAQTALEVALRQREELEHQLHSQKDLSPGRVGSADPGQVGPKAGIGGAGALAGGSETATTIAAAQARLDDLLLRYTEKHPDVISARETLAQLTERQRQESEAVRRGDPGAVARSGLASNPVYQALQLQLSQTNVEIAALRAQLGEHQRAAGELRRYVNTAPEVEAEFSRLTRGYDTTKAQYNALLERLDKARLSDDAEQTGVVKFEIIEPPTSPARPVAPNRPVLLVLVLLVALGVGLFAAFLMSELRPVFADIRSLGDATGLPVLGVVSLSLPELAAAEFRKSARGVLGVAGALIAALVAVILVNQTASYYIHKLIGLG